MNVLVDNSLQVDASVMPIHISAHTQATVYAIAEKVRFQFQLRWCKLLSDVLGC